MEKKWKWSVTGTQESTSSTVARPYADHGLVTDDTVGTAGEALAWCLHRAPFWDAVDQDHPMTVTLEPLPREG